MFVMAAGTEGGVITQVCFMASDGMVEDSVPVPVEFPQTKEDVIQCGDVMDMEVIGGIAEQTGWTTVTQNPVGIHLGCSDTLLGLEDI